MKLNPLTCIDFYKADHRRQYPEGTTLVYSNFTPRSDKLCTIPADVYDGTVTFFGLQYFVKHFLVDAWNQEFFGKPKAEVVAKYKRRMDTSLGVGAIPVEHIESLHDLGYLPICIKALPEGCRVPIKVPVLVIYNTHPDFFWLTNYLETILSCYLWKPMTSATVAHHYRILLERFAEETGADKGFVNFQAHDFSFRGMSGPEDAALSGAGHLASFCGTDSVPAIDLIEDYYNGDAEKELIGCSVPATEHSVISMGSREGELETFRRLITQLYPAGIVSIVSDTWDFWKVVTEYAVALKPEILAREGKLVFRPDSGDPVKIICGEAYKVDDSRELDLESIQIVVQAGYTHLEHRGTFYAVSHAQDYNDGIPFVCEPVEPTPALKGAVQCLWEVFGGTMTEKAFKVLDSHVGLIYGDSITLARAKAILEGLKAKGFASSNVVFGIGSYTYQYATRDTFGFAVKSTYGEVNGVGREIYKDPKTDDGVKKSARGLIKVTNGAGGYCLVDRQAGVDEADCCLRPVFRDGKLLIDDSISEIRKRVAA
ncbi:MAG: nicotinate phosphoribosyltransferase [Paludisphaera borealis]|nr:nicotinate phosphoribosyltransferase [Paludisphaera borealis]MDR3620489.1 nicotinate phosphoribosyltransferase [Paludisphaera borealis]